MADPFAAALAVLHRAAAPGTVAADYTPIGEATRRITVVRAQGTETVGLNGDEQLVDVNRIQIQRADVAIVVAGSTVDLLTLDANGNVVATESFGIQGGATLDIEGLTWNCPIEPLA